MSRAAGLCKYCGGPRRGRSARTATPWGRCARCEAEICERHSIMENAHWICPQCAKAAKPKAAKRTSEPDPHVWVSTTWESGAYPQPEEPEEPEEEDNIIS